MYGDAQEKHLEAHRIVLMHTRLLDTKVSILQSNKVTIVYNSHINIFKDA
jgi:hypothetical protein